MLTTIYGRALNVLLKKPFKLWGISLLAVLLSGVLGGLCGFAIPILGVSVGLLIGTSMTVIFLRGYRGQEVGVLQLFECFKDWNTIKRVLLGLGWMYLWVFLWALIPIVGPFIALIRMYEYRLTPYILVFEPNVPITDAIKISAQKTDGYKMQMFLADFVYILLYWAATFVLGMLSGIPGVGPLFVLALLVLSIAFIALSPLFIGLVQAAFYEEINNKSVKYCPRCGCMVAANTAFCPNCGNPVP